MFIDRINERLKELNMKGSDLCKSLNIPTSNYTQWKTFIPRGTLLKQIADALNVSVDWLLEREDAPEPDETKLLKNYQACDEAGKETIISVAELQAKRCRKVVTWKQTADEGQDEQDELKPFA